MRRIATLAWATSLAVATACTALTGLDGLRGGAASGADGGATPTPGDDARAGDLSDASGDGAGVCSADLARDPNHCGACGRSCFGASCVNGTCAAELVASGQLSPSSIAVDETGVYWANQAVNGQVLTCPVNGCSGAPLVLADQQTSPFALVHTGATTVGWVSQGSILRYVAKDGGAPTTIESVSDVADMAASGPYVYVSGRSSNSVLRCSIRSADAGKNCYTAGSMTAPESVAITDGVLYVTGQRVRIMRCTAATCSFGTFAGSLDRAIVVRTDRDRVYWLEEGGGGVLRSAPTTYTPDAGTIETWAVGAFTSLAMDDGSVYVASRSTGEIVRVSKFNPQSKVTVARDEPGIAGVAVGSSRVFWTNAATGKIWSAPK